MGRFVYPICALNKVPYGICKFSVPIKWWLLKKTATHYVPSSDIEGTSVNLVNSGEYAPIKFEIMGNTIQEGTPAPTNPVPIQSVGDNENLFDISNTKIDYNVSSSVNNDVLTLINIGNYCRTAIKITGLKIGEKYILKCHYKNNDSASIQLRIMDSENNNQIQVGDTITNTDGTTDVSFTAVSTTHYIRFYSNTTSTSSSATVSFSSIKLEQGSTASSYSPYNMGSIQIEKCNKNWLDLTKAIAMRACTIQVQENRLSVTTSGNQNAIIKVPCVLPAGTYYIHIVSSSNLINMAFYNASDTKIVASNVSTSKAITINEELAYINLNLTNTVTTFDINFEDVYINNGSSDLGYIAHASTTYPIYTQAPMRSIGDVRDDFVKLGEVWYERHKIGKVVVDGTEEGWNKASTSVAPSTTRFYRNFTDLYNSLSSTDNTVYVKSNELIGLSWVQIYTTDTLTLYAISNYNDQNTTTGRFVVRVESSVASTVETFKTWLGTHNITAYYVKKEPTLTECTQEQVEQLEAITKDRLYLGGTSFYSNDEIPPYLLIKYYTAETEAEESEEEDNERN